MRQIRFKSTVRDLEDAWIAEQVQQRGTWVYYRWGTVVIALIWAFGGYLFFFNDTRRLLQVSWLVVGLTLLWGYGIKPYLAKRKIRLGNSLEQDIEMHIGPDGIHVDLHGIGSYKREWSELLGATLTRTGILLYFDDDIKNWLPRRVFSDKADMRNVYDLLEGYSSGARVEEVGQGEQDVTPRA